MRRCLLLSISALLMAVQAGPGGAQITAAQVARPDVAFVTLGTGGGPIIRTERSEPANAVIVGNAVYLFDIGAGTQRQLAAARINPRQVQAIFLSHLHIDHTADLAPFLLNRWVLNDFRPMPVIGPRGTGQTIAGIVGMAGPVALAPVTIGGPDKPPFVSSVKAENLAPSMPAPTLIYSDANIRVLAVTNAHYNYSKGSPADRFSRSYAFRTEARGKVYVYTGDTGPSPNLVELARGADVLVSEVIDMAAIREALKISGTVPEAMLPALLAHMEHDHLTPPEIGKLAKAAGVKQVVLTHLVPGNGGERDLTAYTRGIAEHFPGPVTIARDLDNF